MANKQFNPKTIFLKSVKLEFKGLGVIDADLFSNPLRRLKIYIKSFFTVTTVG
jgi:hypothetical protein